MTVETQSNPSHILIKVSRYSLFICFGLFVIGILIDKKPWKVTALSLSILPLAVWGYVQFMVDFTDLKKNVFAYNALAEGTLANIAEAQDRYKSEQGVFLKDLQELYSHVAGIAWYKSVCSNS